MWRSSQPIKVMWSRSGLPNHTFLGQAYSSKRLTSWISGWSISMKECCQTWQDETCDCLITSRTHIQLSHWGQLSGAILTVATSNTVFTLSINPYPAVHNYPYLCKQCRSRSDGFWRSHLIRTYTVCHSVCELNKMLYNVIWFADSQKWVKQIKLFSSW